MEQNRELLAKYKDLVLSEANEAETRLKVIDRVLFEILGWKHDDVSVEERVSEDGKTTFADYILRTGMTALVIEAKKAGRAQIEVPNTRRYELNRKLMEADTGDAVRQARDYARKLGIPFAVVTNGGQWIIFPATRIDQVRFEDSSAIIFPTLQSALDSHYAEFSALLSRNAVIQGSLESELLGRIENQLEQRRLNAFYAVPFSKLKRTNLYYLIEDAISTAFSEEVIKGDPDLLEKLYVRTPERVRFDSRIQMHVAKRQIPLIKQPKRPMKDKEADALPEIIATAANRGKPVAVLVLGTVGAGKTTFLNFTREVAARERFEPRKDSPYPHWIYIDFRDFAPGESPVDFMFSALKTYIEKDLFLSDYNRCLRPAYQDQIEALLRGPLRPISENEDETNRRIADLLSRDYELGVPYVEKILSYASKNAPIFLVIDNIDQFESESLQPKIFSDAIAISHRLGLNLILSLRDATYVNQRSLPVFDAFDFDPIYIDAPNIDAILSRRFFLARNLMANKPAHFVAENGADISLQNSSIIIELVQSSVLGTQVGQLIDVLAASDIRLALRITREFLQYGYTATGHALEIYHSTGRYILPQHEALRAILLGNQTVYSDKYSVVGNPFDAKLARSEAQFLRLYVLTALVNLSSIPSFQYCRGTDVRNYLAEIGFGEDVSLTILSDLCKFRFIHTLSHSSASITANYVPTRLGGYIVRKLIAENMFLENIMMDTFIADNKIWQELRELTDRIYAERDEVTRLKTRMLRSELFYEYVRRQYDLLRKESVRRGLPKEWCSHPLEALAIEFRDNLKRALYSAEQNYPESSELVSSLRRNVKGYVRWFDASKGFGFVSLPDGPPDAFLSIVMLRRAGLDHIASQSMIECDIIDAERGPQISRIHSVTPPPPKLPRKRQDAKLTGVVKFYDSTKGFGFIVPDGGGPDVFVQATALMQSGMGKLLAGQRVAAIVSAGRAGPRAEIVEPSPDEASKNGK